MASGMPELGSKISLISKADIRYEGRLFTVDPQDCTIALANVRSFGTEDRETQFPVAPQNQVYEYILFRGTDIKDIRVVNSLNTLPNDPAIVQMTVTPSMSQQSYQPQSGYAHSIMGQMGPLNNQYGAAYGIPMSSVNPIMGLTSQNRQGVLDMMNMGSRSTTPTSILTRKSPTIDQAIQVGHQQHGSQQATNTLNRNKGEKLIGVTAQTPHRERECDIGRNSPNNTHYVDGNREAAVDNTMKSNPQNLTNNSRSSSSPRGARTGWPGSQRIPRNRGVRVRGNFRNNHLNLTNLRPKSTLKFDNDYDFEQANTEFEVLRLKLAKTKIDSGLETEKKDDSGNETGAGDGEVEEEIEIVHYDKSKSFFDNISCEAVERSKGRSQRTDWRTERKLNSETFGISSMRRGGFRGRGFYPRNTSNVSYRTSGNLTNTSNTHSARGNYRNNRGNNKKNTNQLLNGTISQGRLVGDTQSSSKP